MKKIVLLTALSILLMACTKDPIPVDPKQSEIQDPPDDSTDDGGEDMFVPIDEEDAANPDDDEEENNTELTG